MTESASRKDRIPGDRARFRDLSRASVTQTAESNYGLALSVTLDEQVTLCQSSRISLESLLLCLGAILSRVREVSLAGL